MAREVSRSLRAFLTILSAVYSVLGAQAPLVGGCAGDGLKMKHDARHQAICGPSRNRPDDGANALETET
jgi:hypothetical protein